MIKKLVTMFKTINELEELSISNYILRPGLYFIIRNDKKIEGPRKIQKGQAEENILYEWIKKADYYSQLIDMHIPEENIYGTSYLSICIKDTKIGQKALENQIIEYYQEKQQEEFSKKAKKLIEVLNTKSIPNQTKEANCKLVCDLLPEILQKVEEYQQEGEVKIFFEESIQRYKQEYGRYMLKELYKEENDNIYINQTEISLTKSNLGMTYFKYIEENSNLITIEEGLMLKRVFEWLHEIVTDDEIMNKLYIPEEIKFERTLEDEKNMKRSKGYIVLQKGTEGEIVDVERMYKIPQMQ